MSTTESLLPDQLLLHAYSEEAYLAYAISVVKARALARVEDGLKPVQRRILYAMRQLGLTHDVKPRKSALVVGEVLGKYHPHGDSAAYDAMVRMGQDFSLRYPLILKQGNFGSIDGDSAAAMRYTETRLAPIAELLLSELGQGTVNFKENYDGSHQEPELLPARLPFLLLNGTSGIAVGMAADIPSHNINEVANAAIALINNPTLTTNELLDILPGPDFASGAQLISTRAEILAAYEGGRGSLRARARWKKEELARGQYNIIIYELPYQVSPKLILEQLDTLTNPQPPAGKKVITQQQANLKQIALDLLEKATDTSDKDENIRLVLSPRTAKVDAETLMTFLFANTSLESAVGVNMTIVGLDGRPRTKGLKSILAEWVDFRFETVRRRLDFNLTRTKERIHLLEGRLLAYLKLDIVIKLIRESDDPKQALISELSLSEIQATDILEMRLRQLNRLEGLKLKQDLAELAAEAARLTKLLESRPAMQELIISEIKADATRFGDNRRTLIKSESKAVSANAVAKNVPDEALTIIVSKNLWTRAKGGHDLDESTLTYKAGDDKFAIVKTRTLWPVVFLDSKGRSYSLQASDIPYNRGDGVPLSTLIDIQDGAQIVQVLSAAPDQLYILAGRSGYGFIAQLKNLVATRKAGKAFLTLKDNELPMPPVAIPSTEVGYVLVGSGNGRLLAYPISELKSLANGGQGVVLMGLDDGESLAAVGYAEQAPVTLPIVGAPDATLTLKGAEWDKYVLHRARKGFLLPKKAIMRN